MLKRRIKRPAKGSINSGRITENMLLIRSQQQRTVLLLSTNAQLDKFSVYYSIDLETFAESVVQIR
jgi:hypothetical protein